MHFWRKLIYHEKFRRKAKGGRTNGPPERSSYLEKMKIRITEKLKEFVIKHL